MGALVVLVAIQLSVLGLYLPPVFKPRHGSPPQTIISLPVQTAVCKYRAEGALVVLVGVQLSVLGLYLPPVFKWPAGISAPDDHFTAGPHCRVIIAGRGRVGRAGGCPTIRAGIVSPAGVSIRKSAPDDHLIASPYCRVFGSARGRVGGAGGYPTIDARIVSPAGVESWAMSVPPQTIISLPVQTAVCKARALGALVVLVALQLFVAGLYLPPVFKNRPYATPDNHFTAGPDRRVPNLGQRAR